MPESSQVPGAGRRPGYSYRLALLGLVASGLIVIAAFALPWATASVPLVSGLSGSLTEITFAGRELFALAAAMGWVGLAAVAGIFATRGRGRLIIGLVVLGAGLVTIGSAIGFGVDPEPVLVGALSGRIGSGAPEQWSSTPWWLFGLIGGLGLAAVGGLMLARGRTWPGLSRRYERAAKTKSSNPDGPLSALTAWDALDRGEDPTT
ncbi:MAG: hypothetical protein CK552_06000 [Actinobacteria bacterium]|nr:MAG: hypothetical protein CK552_06000 [Actinomycetota bacterium]